MGFLFLFMVSEKLKQSNIMKFVSKFYLIFFTLNACTLIRVDDSIDLGGKFRYIQDYPQTIVYHNSEKYQGTGITVINPLVKSYDFNERYIIALSKNHEDILIHENDKTPSLYWIIDKELGFSSISPMDSLTFHNELKRLDIKLTLSKY